MKKRLTLWMIAVFVPLLLALAFTLTEQSFALSMEREQTRAQMTEGLIAKQVKQTVAELDYTALNEAARQYRGFYAAQGVELLFLYNDVPIGGTELPSEDYQALLTGQRCAMLDTKSKRYAIAEPLTYTVTLLTLRDMSDLYTQRDTMRRISLLAALVGAALVALLSWLLATRFTRPVQRLTHAATALGNGEPSADELPTQRKDEIGALAQAFARMQAAIARREQSLRDEAENRQALLDALAHEMRTPLCALLGNARLMQNDALPAERRHAIAEQMAREIKRLTDMDAQLMKLTRLSHEPIEKAPVFVRALLTDTAARLRAQADGIAIEVTGKDATIEGDAALLSLLCDNLAVNALRASQSGRTVTLEALPDGFAVRDCGVGMTEEQLAHACEPFFKADKARTRKAGGAGLGLSLCQRVAELHGGALVLRSRPGQGTTAIFTTSLQPVADSVTPPEVSFAQEVDEP